MKLKGFKDLSECHKTRHDKLKLKKNKNGRWFVTGYNTCKKPCCIHCLPVLLYKQRKSIEQAIQTAKDKGLSITMLTINLPKNQNQSLLFQRKILHKTLCDFLRTSTKDRKQKPASKTTKKIFNEIGVIGYIYKNEVSFAEVEFSIIFNPHTHLIIFSEKVLTDEQREKLTENLIQLCIKNHCYISKRQSFTVKSTILKFSDEFDYNYLTKVKDNDAVNLSKFDDDFHQQAYREFCKSQICLNSKENREFNSVPLIYWQPNLKKKLNVKEIKENQDDFESVPISNTITDYMRFYSIESKKLVQIVNEVGNIEILNNPLIFQLLSKDRNSRNNNGKESLKSIINPHKI